MQAKEIDILKTEINLYKRKGGHIYTKVTTNRRVAHLNNDNWLNTLLGSTNLKLQSRSLLRQ